MGTRALTDRAAGVDALAGSQSVRRGLDLLLLISTQDSSGGSSLSELASTSGLPKATTRRLLQELVHSGFVARDPDTLHYYLGAASFVVGNIAGRRFEIHGAAVPVLARVAASTGDTAFLSVRSETWSVCLHREEGEQPIRSNLLQAGDRHPLGIGAGSIAMLAAFSDDQISEIVAHNSQHARRRYPGCTPDVIAADIERAREVGYAFNPGRVVPQSWGVGAAIRSPDGEVHGAISVACVRHRMPPERQAALGGHLMTAAADVAHRLAQNSIRRSTGRSPI